MQYLVDDDQRQDFDEGYEYIVLNRYSPTECSFTDVHRRHRNTKTIRMASRGIAANCRKVVCIGINYAYALPAPFMPPRPLSQCLRLQR